jgi:hypothetical protein
MELHLFDERRITIRFIACLGFFFVGLLLAALWLLTVDSPYGILGIAFLLAGLVGCIVLAPTHQEADNRIHM